MEQAIFAAGCFWGVEVAFRKVQGVKQTEVGYTGGTTQNPTYEMVCSGKTGHTEAVRVGFDPAEVSYEELLEVFWSSHDPTQLNRQGPDVGTQYRSGLYFLDARQEQAATDSRQALESSGRFSRPVVTEIVQASEFFLAEDYHQQYIEKQQSRLFGLR